VNISVLTRAANTKEMTSFRNPQDPLNFKCFEMLNRESFVDVTLIADGRFMQCHKLVLAASSGYFEVSLSCHSPVQVSHCICGFDSRKSSV
jgi:BTB/POZ domain